MVFSRKIFTYNSLALQVKVILPFPAAPELPGFSWSPGISKQAQALSRGIMWGWFAFSPWLRHSSAGSAQPVHSTPFRASAPAPACHHPSHTPTPCRAAPTAIHTSCPRWELLTSLTLDPILQRRLPHLFKAPSHIWAQAGKESS